MRAHVRRVALTAAAWLMVLPAFGQAGWKVKQTISIGGQGGWDYLTVDPQTHLLYVPRSTHTQVIDPTSGKVVADIPGQRRAHGVAIAHEAGRGFVSDGGGDGAIVVFDLKSNAVLGTITTLPDTDGIIFDEATGLVLAVSGDEGVLMTLKPDLDPQHGKIDPPIALGGKPEFLASDSTGKAYINLVDRDQVAVVDLRTRKVTAHWPTSPGGMPVGMAIDEKNHRLFIGCRRPQKLIVMSTEDGRILANLPIGAGVDATKFDQGQAFASTGDGRLSVVAETSPGNFEVVQTVDTRRGARTMGIDTSSHTIFLPTAEFEEAAPGTRPAMKPDTFMILVVSRE